MAEPIPASDDRRIAEPLTDLPIGTADSGFYRGFSKHVTIPGKVSIALLIGSVIFFP